MIFMKNGKNKFMKYKNKKQQLKNNSGNIIKYSHTNLKWLRKYRDRRVAEY